MKIKYTILAAAVSAFIITGQIGNAQAQNLKIGHVNSNTLLELMPEKSKASAEVEKFAKLPIRYNPVF
mgnify:CR=1 FL=1